MGADSGQPSQNRAPSPAISLWPHPWLISSLNTPSLDILAGDAAPSPVISLWRPPWLTNSLNTPFLATPLAHHLAQCAILAGDEAPSPDILSGDGAPSPAISLWPPPWLISSLNTPFLATRDGVPSLAILEGCGPSSPAQSPSCPIRPCGTCSHFLLFGVSRWSHSGIF